MAEHGHVNNGNEIWNTLNFIIYQYLQYDSEQQTTTDQNTFIFVSSKIVHEFMNIYPILLSLITEPLPVPIWNRHAWARFHYKCVDVIVYTPLLELYTPCKTFVTGSMPEHGRIHNGKEVWNTFDFIIYQYPQNVFEQQATTYKYTFVFISSDIVQVSMQIYPILLLLIIEPLPVPIWNMNAWARCHSQRVDVIVYTPFLEVYNTN